MSMLLKSLGLRCYEQLRLGSLIPIRHHSIEAAKSLIDQTVKSSPLVVFMKGRPEQPMCGFSRAVVNLLEFHKISTYKYFNVLEDDDVRTAVKEYSNWPTIPQIFLKGEFIGGCDILMNLHQSGELRKLLIDAGLVKEIDSTSETNQS